MKRKKQLYIIIVLIIISVVLIAAVSVLSAFCISAMGKQKESEQAFAILQEMAGGDTAVPGSVVESANARINALENDKARLESELAAAKAEKEELVRSFEDSDSRYRELNERLDALNAEIADRDAQIKELEQNIAKLETVYMVDINAQFDILNELAEKLANPVQIEIKTEITHEDGTVTEEITYENPRIALYYEDINNGYKYAYNADEVFDPASMIKAPFILSLLEAASEEEAKIEEARAAAEEAGTPFTEPERTFDMTKKVIYTKSEYYQPGSGEIRESEDGTEYTYKDLFYHVLECSDNVAYAILRNTFGTGYYGDLVVRLNAVSMYKKPTGMSAADAGKCMKAIYEFTESDAFYAGFMKDAMIGSRHQVMIPYAVSPKKTAHKYGWDTGAYNDMGIVYADNPYVLAILTNYDEAGKEVNEYIQSVLSLVDKMHDNFYKQR
jgi:beta-lactamase class A